MEGHAGEEEPQGHAHWPQGGVTLVSWICWQVSQAATENLAPRASALQGGGGGRNKNSQGEASGWTVDRAHAFRMTLFGQP